MPSINVLNPVIYDDTPTLPLAHEIAALKNARIAFVDNSKVNADVFLSRVKALLAEKFGTSASTSVRKLAPKDDLSDADVQQLAQCDAVIQGFGD
jgi:hypothetical protein